MKGAGVCLHAPFNYGLKKQGDLYFAGVKNKVKSNDLRNPGIHGKRHRCIITGQCTEYKMCQHETNFMSAQYFKTLGMGPPPERSFLGSV